MANSSPEVVGLYEKLSGSVQYVCIDPATQRCAIIDPVLNYDANSARATTESADEIIALIRERELGVDWILDTHPHADHLSAAIYLQEHLDAPRAIGEHVVDVQKLWKDIYNFGDDFPTDGSQWDRLFADGDIFKVGDLQACVMHSPGHTLASITYVIGDAAFVHDTLFMPDFGTARADFPGGDAGTLYQSIQRILDLPDATRVFTGHDYMPDGREPEWESTIAEQRDHNPHLQGMTERDYIKMRNERDAELPLPAQMLAALQINTRGGRLPEPEDNGTAYLKIPLNRF
ncbi:MAG: MBL fold metallo-hydrolase [Salinisphaera sp.]|jgi:glyoxylase-like metal-dependent hydrolase (beta-lactamase superfamily II)|nr:MBL fold metallo-hydrolase [Salinisphaera sp.]